jgi:hypothetical protein
MNDIEQAKKDTRDSVLNCAGIRGLLNFSCYARTEIDRVSMKEQFQWCEKQFGEHDKRWLFIPSVIEKDYVYWFFSKQKEKTLFQLRWTTIQ